MARYKELIENMFARESPYYTKGLLLSLGDNFNMLPSIWAYAGNVYAIYGDRGQAVGKEHYSELCLPQDVLDSMHICFVRDSCHLPMIENPEGLLRIMNSILIE